MGLEGLAVHIVILRRFRYLQGNLDKAARKVFDRNELAESGL